MSDINPSVVWNQLSMNTSARYISQRHMRQSLEKVEAIASTVKGLLNPKFISKAKYMEWMSNVVLIKKASGKWRMCIDYTDLNRACPKDFYLLPNIDKLVDKAMRYELLSLMDAYSGYNHIHMYGHDQIKTTIITEHANYQYNFMPFGLKNVNSTYQIMMKKIFQEEIGDTLVYMNDMIVKSSQKEVHAIAFKGCSRGSDNTICVSTQRNTLSG